MSLKDLKKVQNDDIDVFTLEGLKTKAKVISVHDGDTLDVVFYIYGDNLVRYTCRLLGYDAPELTSKKKNPSLRLRALRTRDFLAHLCMGDDPDDFDDNGTWEKYDLQELLDESRNLVYVEFGEFDSFGRVLATIKTSPRGESINDMVSDFVDNLY